MDALGTEGCRSQKAELSARLAEKAGLWTVAEKAAIAARAALHGMALRINLLRPFESLVAEAIRRSELSAQV